MRPGGSGQVRVAGLITLLHHLRPFGRHLAGIFLLIGLHAVLAPMQPLVLREILDNGLSQSSRFSMPVLLVAFGAIPLLQLGLGSFQNYLMISMAQGLTAHLRQVMFRAVSSRSLRFFQSVPSGETLQRVLHEPAQIASAIQNQFIPTLDALIHLGMVLLIMARVDTKLTLIALCILPLYFVDAPLMARFLLPVKRRLINYQAELSTRIQTVLSQQGILALATERERKFVSDIFDNVTRQLAQQSIRAAMGSQAQGAAKSFVQIIGPVILYTAMIGTTDITAGMLMAFSTYLVQLSGPAQNLSNLYIGLKHTAYQWMRMDEWLSTPPDLPVNPSQSVLPEHDMTIRIEDLSFGYAANSPILDHLTCTIRQGEQVALVGASGAGKTTLAYLMARFLDPQTGRITLGGHDLRSLPLDLVRQSITLVTREPHLLPGTVWENLTLGDDRQLREEVVAIAKSLHIHGRIMQLPHGYDSSLQECGSDLSAGEKQRLVMVRALLHKSPVIILDEATSATDAQLEDEIFYALDKAAHKSTLIVIAHRLSTIMKADRILVLSGGAILEQGSHAALMKAGTIYPNLIATQLTAGD